MTEQRFRPHIREHSEDNFLETLYELVEWLTNPNIPTLVRYNEFREIEEELDPKIRGIIKYCIGYEVRPGVFTEEIKVIQHDIAMVLSKLNQFEHAVTSSDGIVLLTACSALQVNIQILSGQVVTYTPNRFGYWGAVIDDNEDIPPIHIGNICSLIADQETLYTIARRNRSSLEFIPLIGIGVITAYIELLLREIYESEGMIDPEIERVTQALFGEHLLTRARHL